MKYVLSLCIFTAFFISLAHCDCTGTCRNTYTSAVKGQQTASQICPIMQNLLTCLDQSCKLENSTYYVSLKDAMKTYGVFCDLNGASRSVSFSLLTVCGSVLLTAYRIFSM